MIKSIRLQNFRSYTNKSFSFSDQANIIIGPNTAGKTNLLEAILVSRLGTSYRAHDIDLIAFNKDWARIDSNDGDQLRTVKIEKQKLPIKSFDINGHIYKRLSANTRVPVVIFEPNHLRLLSGSPERRRAYLDDFIEQIDGLHGTTLRKFNRALAQRNSLLKSPHKPSTNALFPWNIRISQLGGQLVKARVELVGHINTLLPSIYNSLSSDKVKTHLVYRSQLSTRDYESHYLKKLETELDEDLRTGFTSIGPHRDDFDFMFNDHTSTNYASRGELRTAILTLKITELETIKSRVDTRPVILLDDVYSELDNSRRSALTAYLKDNQSFITTTDADTVKNQLKSSLVINL
jgi:DNA replication and repair protein RecF